MKDFEKLLQSSGNQEPSLEKYRRLIEFRAKVNKIFYDSLVKEGFSKAEALELVKYRGM